MNYELGWFGIAVRCPRTGRPGLLIAQRHNGPGDGRFLIETLEKGIGDEPPGHKRVSLGKDLPTLELIADDGSRSIRTDWFSRLAQRSPEENGSRR